MQKVFMPHMSSFRNEQSMLNKPLLRALPLCLVWLLAACGSDGDEVTMERRAQTLTGRAEWKGGSVTSAVRFGSGQQPGQGHAGHGGQPKPPSFIYETPEGWVEDAPTQFRLINFKVAGRDDAACYLTALPGSAGGVLENVNRWRAQFGAARITDAEMNALPKTPLLALPALRLEIAGPFSDGMSGVELSEGALVGLILKQDNTMVFLKMVGPKDVIEQEMAHFDSFVASLTFPGVTESTDSGSAARTMLHEAPEDWAKQGARQMRLLGYDLPGGVDLSVTVLGGAAGGVAANINRWRGQLGIPALPEAELLAGERIDCLGESAYWVNMEGAYAGMSGEAKTTQDTMMAVVIPMAKETIFVKCVGPSTAMQTIEPVLRSFVASLKWETSQ
ncbi:MAG: hypothetical protein ACI9X4_000695 [Glaciecola sp.]|jgi:hypothetical protein